MEINGQNRQDIGVILRKLCQQKGVEIIEVKACPDHIQMFVSIRPKYSVAQIMGYLKGKKPYDIRPTRQFKVQIWKFHFILPIILQLQRAATLPAACCFLIRRYFPWRGLYFVLCYT
jgi:REP element-mobilizing transposase RayT